MKGLIVKDHKLMLSNDVSVPDPNPGEVLVKVVAASVNPTDKGFAEGDYDELLPENTGFHRVRTGLEFAGIVSEDAKPFSEGDNVYGYVDLLEGYKSHQEYLVISKDCIAKMPRNLTFEESASLPLGALTSLIALRDVGQLSQDEEVLIYGAAGGLGVFAVQLASQHFKASVTAVAGPGESEFLSSLGASHVYNYRQHNVFGQPKKYDLIFDLSTTLCFSDVKDILSERGRFIPADPYKNQQDFHEGSLAASKTKYLMVAKGVSKDLELISKWTEVGDLKTFVDSTYPLSEFAMAFDRLMERSKHGRIVLRVSDEH